MSEDDVVKDKVLARVRKMLALANNEAATEGERDNALRMAHAALAKYNLSLGDAEIETEPRVEDSAQISPHPWARYLIEAIANLYFCKTLFYLYRDKRQVHHFVGRESNVVTAIEMSKYIVGSINREARRKAKENPYITGYERAFCKGAATAVYHRCKLIQQEAEQQASPQASTGTSLVLASLYRTELEKNALVIAQKHGPLSTMKRAARAADANAFGAGQQYGSKLNLNRQVSGGSSNAARLK